MSSHIPEACSRFLSAVSDLAADSAPSAAEHHAHRAACPGCDAEYALARRIQDQLTTLPEVEPPETLWAGLQSRLDATDREPGRARQRVPGLVPRLVRSPARS